MSVWRYSAVPIAGQASERRSGEIAGDSALTVRQSLRRIGLQVIELRPARRRAAAWPGRDAWRAHLRRRRGMERAELYDSLATMLDSGLPLLEALDTAQRSLSRGAGRRRSMLVQLREDVRSGSALSQAMGEHDSWFDPAEIAMVAAGQHSGNLSSVLRTLAERHERSGEIVQRLVAALAYPAIVSAVGLGVVVFLSTQTLPGMVTILTDADVETPALTGHVLAFGQFVAARWVLILVVALGALLGGFTLRRFLIERGVEAPGWLRALSPRVGRRLAIAHLARRLSDLVRSGVPLTEALRVLAPTTNQRGLRRRVLEAADQLEAGQELAGVMTDEHWFDPEFRRLLGIGQASGELDELLERIGQRYERQANRLIDRLTTLLEPAVILTLAFLIGLVVMAAVLPMVRLQEVLG